MFHLTFAQIVQVRLPMPGLLEIFGDMFRKQNVPGIAAIHYALRDVDAGASDIRALVDVDHAAYRTAVYAHAQPQFRMRFQGAANFQCALDRLLGTFVKDERHPVT